jgi:type II secretory pathway component PulF
MSLIVTPGQLNSRAELYHQLGTMLTAGIPLIKALELVSVRPAVRGSRSTLLQLINDLQEGLSFTESLSRSRGWLPEFDMALLATGEKTGRLDTSFRLLSVYYATRASIIRDTISGMLTTMATLHVFLLLFPLGYLTEFAQGIFNGDFTRCIPFLIQKLVVFGGLYGGVFLLIYACQGRRGEHWRSIVEGVTQMIPILRTAQKYLVVSRLAAALEALISAGVSILTGWELASAASGSPTVKREVASWKPALEMGTTPAELVNQTSYFPEMFANFYMTGEQSGQLDDSLRRVQAYYQEEGFRLLRLFTRFMNGSIYGALVLIVAYNVIKFYTGYYNNIMNSF